MKNRVSFGMLRIEVFCGSGVSIFFLVVEPDREPVVSRRKNLSLWTDNNGSDLCSSVFREFCSSPSYVQKIVNNPALKDGACPCVGPARPNAKL